jgi:hypothetical protein
MSRSQATIEEQVMSSARTYLFGHALAWELPGRERGAIRSRAERQRRARALLGAVAPRLVQSRGATGRTDASLGGC